MSKPETIKVKKRPDARDKALAKTLKMAWLEKKSKDKSYSQEKLAGRLGLTQAGVSHYLNGRRIIKLEQLIQFCNELDIKIADVYPNTITNEKEAAEALEFLSLFLAAEDGIKKGVLSILRSS